MNAALAATLLSLVTCLLFPTAARAQHGDEVPFITSSDDVTRTMLEIAGVGPRDHVIDLGSGDGRIVITAARRYGATGLGVEIVPDLVKQSIRGAEAAGVADRAQFRVQDLFDTDLSRATVVTMYLLPEVNLQLRPRVLQLRPGTRVVSHDWDMGDWEPDETRVVANPGKQVGLDKTSRVHLWVVPAAVAGSWCGEGAIAGTRLVLSQRYQEVSGSAATGDAVRSLQGRMRGTRLEAGDLELLVAGDALRVSRAAGAWRDAQGQAFRRAQQPRC